MTPEAMRRLAAERLRERARRIGIIRRSVIAGAAATFALAWGLALSDQIAHGTKTKPADTSTSSSQGSDQSTPATPAQQPTVVTEDGIVVPVNPQPTTVAPVTPAPAPAPAPLTTSQS